MQVACRAAKLRFADRTPMGFRYRKSLNLGPFRVNLSTGGVGFSIGGRGLRTGVSSRGRRYTTFGIPGTGMSYHHTHGRRGCLWWLVLAVGIGAAGCFSAARILP